MVPQAEKNCTPDLTSFGPIEPGALAHLERDRWPEFERELWRRRPRKFRFHPCNYDGERRRWEWLVWRCRTWDEVERVLNRHRADWERVNRYEIRLDGMSIHRQ